MKFIKNEKDLVGKTIAFAHMAPYAENITIATDDGCVLVIRQVYDEDTDDSKINIFSEPMALRYIERCDCVREQLGDLGIFDIEAYKKKKQEEVLRLKQEREVKKLKEERELYEKLKAKFESCDQQ